ncbi:PREDICTED: kinesin-like protein KIN-7E isoform X2 [Ipomoea nil]|uniref:kinesin-like protein KIN-7E isoform X2 n=1 Tax=Ipomoea nil TaxID=35883 RepID=UPI000900F1A5|nr:PREDICTED: kinesin-like protein KIN-7E isoform X2 [Ipomoea nil]
MGAIDGEESMKWDKMQGTGLGEEEKILVLVRLRPLSEKEISRNEVSDWECINETTILYRNSLQERSGLPTAYTFDRVYRGDCSTREVYDGGSKDIALSVVRGVNSTIFAYGQTSSGKTYTMNGITEYTVADIYDYIQKHEERAFVLKFSAMEIYNEVVRDLLSSDNSPLRLLDDPEKGTIIEKLTEETLRDWNHLKELLSICEAQRQIGETYLNETSSRSHQILRLVSVGQRLKEGCHINRSLLTLGTVIRKLSKGRNGHVNYRDSKLTRILQPALGGNARTAIICTLSPARSHVEQSRNTLLFACCAKEVTTNAQVNVVMSDKALVKHLQKELARLESELRGPGTCCDHVALLRKKDMQIEKLEKEVKELSKQRDFAQSQVENFLQVKGTDQGPSQKRELSDECSSSGSEDEDEDSFFSSDLNKRRKELAYGEVSDENCKEVHCIEMDPSGINHTPESSRLLNNENENRERITVLPVSSNGRFAARDFSSTSSGQTSHASNYIVQGAPEQKMPGTQETSNPDRSSQWSLSNSMLDSRTLKLTRSMSCRANIMDDSFSPNSEMAEQCGETTPPNGLEKDFPGRPEGLRRKHWKLPPVIYGADNPKLSRNNSRSSNGSAFIDEVNSRSNAPEDDEIPTVDTFVAGLKEMAKIHYEDQAEDAEDLTGNSFERSVKDVGVDPLGAPPNWPSEFERMQKLIIELWQTCNISLIHRTYFFLLFKGDPTDSIYMEVEVRRLSFLNASFSKGNPAVQGGKRLTLASSLKALRRERGMLSRLIYKRFTENERNHVYQKWGIALNSKQRRQKLVRHLWSSTDMNNVTESAAIVAKLIGFSEEEEAPKEMFGLSFTTPRMSRRSFGWRNSVASLL